MILSRCYYKSSNIVILILKNIKYLFLFQFFFDGVVSIASMLEVAVFYLAQNPDLQEKAFEEIQVGTLHV